MTSRFRPRPRLPCAIAFVVAVGCGRGGELDAQAVGTGGAGGDAATEAGAASGKGGAAGTAGAAGTGGPAGGAGGEGGAGGGGTGGSSGAAGGAGEAGASGTAGAPSKLAFAGPDIVEVGRQAYCVVPANWSKDGRVDVVTVHAGYNPSPEYKGYYDVWRIVNGKLTIVAGPTSLEASPGAEVQVGGCATTDLDHDGVVEVTTFTGNQWIRPGAPIGKAFIDGDACDLDADGVWEVPLFSAGGKTLTGRAIESKDGVTWTLGAVAYSLTPPFPYGAPLFGDFDGDGTKDLVLHDVSNTNQIQFLRAAPGGPQMLPVTVLEDFTSAIVADMNGDGRADLVGRGKKGYQVAISDGKGGVPAQVLFSHAAVEGVAAGDGFSVGDVSGDGRPDLILDSAAGVYVLESDGPGTWRPVRLAIEWKHWDPSGDLGQMHLLRIVDMDGDGKNDLVARRGLSLVAFRNITPSP